MTDPQPPPDDGEPAPEPAPQGYEVITPELIDLIEQQSGDGGED